MLIHFYELHFYFVIINVLIVIARVEIMHLLLWRFLGNNVLWWLGSTELKSEFSLKNWNVGSIKFALHFLNCIFQILYSIHKYITSLHELILNIAIHYSIKFDTITYTIANFFFNSNIQEPNLNQHILVQRN